MLPLWARQSGCPIPPCLDGRHPLLSTSQFKCEAMAEMIFEHCWSWCDVQCWWSSRCLHIVVWEGTSPMNPSQTLLELMWCDVDCWWNSRCLHSLGWEGTSSNEPKSDVTALELMNAKQVPTKVGLDDTSPKGTCSKCCSWYKNSWIMGAVRNQGRPEIYLNYKCVADL